MEKSASLSKAGRTLAHPEVAMTPEIVLTFLLGLAVLLLNLAIERDNHSEGV